MAHFKIQHLTFTYPGADKPALEDVTLSIEPGEYLALCGKSGSGKTTLLSHLKSVLSPHGKRTGTVLFNDVPLEQVSLREQSAGIGYVMQNPDSQIVTDKVWHELAFGLESLGCSQQTMRIRVAEMASYFGIQNWFHKDVSKLSGGEKQLLNLASVMAMQPSALILDEPTSQLDPISASDFLNTVYKINRELGTTILLSEHRLEEVFPSADHVAVMEEGRLCAYGTPREVGETLNEQQSDMARALPSAMRVYFAVKEKSLPCPLNVREGRKWLSAQTEKMQPLKTVRVPEEEPLEAIEEKEAAVRVEEAWFRYEKNGPDVLKGVSLSVKRGSVHAVVGGNGTGKTTLLKAVCGIIRPYRGKIYLNGKRIETWKGTSLYRNHVAMLPQDPQNLFVKKTVREELEEMTEGLDKTAEEKEAMIRESAEACEVTALFSSHPYDLSGGEQQRVALAKVLLCEPKILLLDEPTKGMDVFHKEQLSGIFRNLTRQGRTVLLVTHDIEFCAQYADNVSMFFDGAVMTTDSAHRFFAHNSFYTTAASRMSRHVFENAVTCEEVTDLLRENQKAEEER